MNPFRRRPRPKDDGEDVEVERERAFYRDHEGEIVERMRHPSTPTRNTAAELVLRFARSGRLRKEAEAAIETAARASEARAVLDMALAAYDPASRKLA